MFSKRSKSDLTHEAHPLFLLGLSVDNDKDDVKAGVGVPEHNHLADVFKSATSCDIKLPVPTT